MLAVAQVFVWSGVALLVLGGLMVLNQRRERHIARVRVARARRAARRRAVPMATVTGRHRPVVGQGEDVVATRALPGRNRLVPTQQLSVIVRVGTFPCSGVGVVPPPAHRAFRSGSLGA